MTTKSKILSAILLSSVLSVSLYAGHHGGDKSCGEKRYMKHYKGKMHHMPMMKIIKKLDLTSTQKDKIKEIFKEKTENKEGINSAFTSNSFDKEKFIKIMNDRRDNMVESKANMIEKVYNVLTAEQKKKFKTLMDEKKERMYKKH